MAKLLTDLVFCNLAEDVCRTKLLCTIVAQKLLMNEKCLTSLVGITVLDCCFVLLQSSKTPRLQVSARKDGYIYCQDRSVCVAANAKEKTFVKKPVKICKLHLE